jgi:osmoprotectant transport system permease protein
MAFVALACCVLIGYAATYLTPEGNTLRAFRRVRLLGADLRLRAAARRCADAAALSRPGRVIGILLRGGAGASAGLLMSGEWNSLSILKEYANRADSFWREARRMSNSPSVRWLQPCWSACRSASSVSVSCRKLRAVCSMCSI